MGLGCGKACGVLLLRAAGLLAERSSAKRRRFVPSCQRGDGEVAVRGAGVPQSGQGWRVPERLRARGAGLGPTAGFGGRLCARIKPRRVEQETRLFSETPQHPVTLRVLWVTALSCVGQGLRLPSPTGEDLGLCR